MTPSASRARRPSERMRERPRIGVVGATGAVGTVTLALLRERGYEHVRAFASARSGGGGLDGLLVEEATAESALGRPARPLPLLRRGLGEPRARTARGCRRRPRGRQVLGLPARRRGPPRRAGGERGPRARARRDCRQPELLHDPVTACSSRCTMRPGCAGCARRRTSRSREPAPRRWSGCAGRRRRSTTCAWTGTSTGSSSTRRRSSETRRAILELPISRCSATCVRVPVHGRPRRGDLDRDGGRTLAEQAEAQWLLGRAGPRRRAVPDAGRRRGKRRRARRSDSPGPGSKNGLALFVAGDNLRRARS